MVENVAIVALDRKFAYDVSKQLAKVLDMNFLDCLELFEFDNIPRSLATMLKDYGEKYYRKEEKGTIKYASGFCNTVINLESGMACKENFNVVKQNCLLVYLHIAKGELKKRFSKLKFFTEEEEKFFVLTDAKIERRIKALKENANIVINVGHDSALKVCSDVVREMRLYFQK